MEVCYFIYYFGHLNFWERIYIFGVNCDYLVSFDHVTFDTDIDTG